MSPGTVSRIFFVADAVKMLKDKDGEWVTEAISADLGVKPESRDRQTLPA